MGLKHRADLAASVIDDAAKWYLNPTPPPAFADLPPILLDYLWEATGGDWRRCVRNEDGTVDIENARRW